MSDDSIDSNESVANISGEPTTDTAIDSGSANAGTQESGAGQANGTSDQMGSLTGATPDGTDKASLTTDQSKIAPSLAPEAMEWKKRYDGQTRSYQSLKSEFDQARARYSAYEGIDPQAIRAYKEQESRAKQQNLPKWDSQNPNHGRFQQTRSAFSRFRDAYQRAPTAEKKEAIRQSVAESFTADEQRDIQEWESHHQDFTARLAENPAGTIGDLVRDVFKQEFDRQQGAHQAEQEVGQWFSKNADAIKSPEDAAIMQQLLLSGTPFQVAAQQVEMRAQLRSLQSQIGSASQARQSAEAKDQLLKREASVSRDQAVNTVLSDGDIYRKAREEADRKKIPKGDPRFMQIVNRIQATNKTQNLG